ncbi:MAG TPA: cytochrome c [Gemmatimonadales bacterium]|jgi:nitric oxide reductase subunit C
MTFAVLVVAYLIMAGVTYLDYPRHDPDPPLSELARDGLAVWRRNNCQACHQLYGFGGFLGPDLTNRVTAATRDEELEWILVRGSKQMPAFDLPADERRAVLAFLRSVDRTGQSQPTPLAASNPIPPVQHFARIVEAWEDRTGDTLAPPARAGLEIMTRNACGGCHQPFAVSPVRAPDLSGRAVNRSPDALRKVLDMGRGRMPPFPLSRTDVEHVSAFLQWLANDRRALVALDRELLGLDPFTWRDVPWFEYR